MTLLASGGEGSVNEAAITTRLKQWSRIFHYPYQGPLPEMVWQGDDLHWHSVEDFCRWLVVLALWHHENPAGFQADLGRSAKQFARHFPDQTLSTLDQTWLQLWQRLLTLILSERFTLTQLADVFRSPFFLAPLNLTESITSDCQEILQAIATALENYHAPVFAKSSEPQVSYAHTIPWTFYCWGATPDQPRLSLIQAQTKTSAALILPFTSALSGAYNGGKIIRQALTPPHASHTPLMLLINHFAHQHFLQWLGGPSRSSGFSALASSAPLVMQRRSSLKLISQQDYEQFS